MENFNFHNPTRLLFGKGQIASMADYLPKGKKILVTYGGGSIKKNGVYDQVMSSLKEFDVTEFSGIEPNPKFGTLMKAVEIVKSENIDFLLAIGGGSTVDGTKFIAAAARYDGDPWHILETHGADVVDAVPMGCVLTLPATGSESNGGAVVSQDSTPDKLHFVSEKTFPQFAVLDPEVTYTLPPRQIGNGVVDAFTHTMEQYLTYPANAPLQDRFAEGILYTLVEEGPKCLADPKNYDARANVMYCCTMALNTLIACGVPQDWTTHMIGHEITAAHGLDHAQTLAIVLPNVMDHQRERKHAKLLQYAERIWGITQGDDDAIIDQAIEKTRHFFEAMGVKTRLGDYGLDTSIIPQLVAQLEKHGMVALGEHQAITPEMSAEILKKCA